MPDDEKVNGDVPPAAEGQVKEQTEQESPEQWLKVVLAFPGAAVIKRIEFGGPGMVPEQLTGIAARLDEIGRDTIRRDLSEARKRAAGMIQVPGSVLTR